MQPTKDRPLNTPTVEEEGRIWASIATTKGKEAGSEVSCYNRKVVSISIE